MLADSDLLLKRLFWTGILLGVGLSFWYQVNQIIDGDQLQMVQRGYLAAYEQQWPTTGNTASVVGNVPGFLSTAIVAGPLMLWDSPYAPILLLIILRLVGVLLIDAVIRQAYPGITVARVMVLLLLWLNPWVQFDSLLYNPSYLIFCAGLHLYTAWRLRQTPKFWWSFLHVVSIGLAMQLHFSWPLLAMMSVFLWWRQLIRVNWCAVAAAAGLAVVTLLPYLYDVVSNPAITQSAGADARGRYIGWGAVHVYPVLKSMVYWVRYAAWAFPSKLVNDAGFDWLTSWAWLEWTLIWLWRIGQYALAAVTVIIAVIANVMAYRKIRHHWRRRDGEVTDSTVWLLLYSLAAFVAMLISAGLAPIVFNYWHLVLILPAALLPMLVWVISTFYGESEGSHVSGVSTRSSLKPMLIVAVFLIGTNIVAINDSRKFSWQASYAQQVQEYVDQTFDRGAR
jgi:hypothetical protein